MTRTDSFVVGTLVVLFALIAGLVGLPALQPPTAVTATPSDGISTPVARPYREGVLGRPVSVSPLTARTQADRDLVALVFSGLVRNGPDGTIVPDLAERWTVNDTGAIWTFYLRPEARWQDGEPVTSEDVAFTIQTLQDPAYTGPAAGSWNEVSVTTPDPHTVVMTLATPLGGFLQAATQAIAPAHLLADTPVGLLAQHPFGRQPIGSGPFAVISLDENTAQLVPSVSIMPPLDSGGGPGAEPTDSLASPTPAGRPSGPTPYLAGIEMTFYDTPDALASAYRDGTLDAASGLPAAVASGLVPAPGSRVIRYPSSTLTAVLFNLRPGHPAFADPKVRTALLAAIDRSTLIKTAFGGLASSASGPIPPSSPLFDPAADPPVPFDRAAARAALKTAGWTVAADGWRLPKAKKPITIEVLSPDAASNPAAFAAAESVAGDWAAIGLAVTHTAVPPAEFATGRLAKGDFDAVVGDITIGLDPDLYPLLASSQTRTGGSNVIGLQDPALDKLLVTARGPGTMTERESAYSTLEKQLAVGRYLLPLAFADEVTVARDTLEGPAIRQVADPADRFWDVLTWRLAAGR
jgi:peptide/nickel transport system substrate-binding protein